MSETQTRTLPDFVELHRRYRRMADNDGDIRSQLGKRVAAPDDLALRPAFYKLFLGERPPAWGERVVFFLPLCSHASGAKSIGAQLAAAGISEARLLSVVRADPPNDLIQLRRLVQHIEPAVDWAEFGNPPLFFKRQGRAGKLVTVTFDGTLRVHDPEAVRRVAGAGIGAAKSFGCGLLSLARAT